MKNKHVVILGIIVIFLVAALIVKKTAFAPQDILSYGDLYAFFPDTTTTADVTDIVLFDGATPDKTIELKREGQAWRIVTSQNAAADMGLVAGLLGHLEKMKGEPRADDPKLHTDFQVDDASAVHIIVKDKDGKEIANVLAGKGDWKSSFVRPADSDVVYAVEDNLRGRAGYVGTALDPAKWLDKVALRLPEEHIDTITLTTPKGTVTFTKEKQTDTPKDHATPTPPAAASWSVQGGTWIPDPKQAAQELARNLLAVRITNILSPEDAAKLDFSKAEYTITTTGKTAKTITALPQKEENKEITQAYLRIDGDPLVYVMPQSEFNSLFLQEQPAQTPPKDAPQLMMPMNLQGQ